MVDSKVLRMKMIEKDCSVEELAEVCALSKTAIYRRLSNKVAFTVPQMLACVDRLGLSSAERDEIFFAKKVS